MFAAEGLGLAVAVEKGVAPESGLGGQVGFVRLQGRLGWGRRDRSFAGDDYEAVAGRFPAAGVADFGQRVVEASE